MSFFYLLLEFRTNFLLKDLLYYTNKILILRRYCVLVIFRAIHYSIHTYTHTNSNILILCHDKLNYIEIFRTIKYNEQLKQPKNKLSNEIFIIIIQIKIWLTDLLIKFIN